MASEAISFIRDVENSVRPLEKAWLLADWEMAASGTEEANARAEQAQAAHIRFWADSKLFERAKSLRETAGKEDAITSRQLDLIYRESARNRQDEGAIRELTRLEALVRGDYYNHRGVVRGRELNDNELETILSESRDPEEAREAWLASKGVGARVSENVRQLARIRNEAARALGYRDHFQRSIVLEEIDEKMLLSTFEELERATREPFERLKKKIDALRAEHFGIRPEDLRPWHYGDRFFQEVPPLGGEDLKKPFEGKDPVALATATYDGMGMDVRDILARSDLYARPGKNQHAFCTHIDRSGDIRTLNNLIPNLKWAETLLHELGHALYEKHLDPALPWLLRSPSHTLTTEAVAILMGGLVTEPRWLADVLGVPSARAEGTAASAKDASRAGSLIFTRWCLVMTGFERALYEDPDRDLDAMWWDLVERYQLLRRPEDRKAPDWAAKIHIALAPVYYHDYELGHLVKEQFRNRILKHAGGIVGKKEAGAWLTGRVFRPGYRQDWARHVESATGEPLNMKYFVESVSG
jgi:peptidyl-dipeptidase A